MIIIELFAGVGGFRLGLEGYKPKKSSRHYSLLNGFKKGSTKKPISNEYYFITGVANQYEPNTKTVQHAARVYENQFQDKTLINENIDDLNGERLLNCIKDNVPKHRLKEPIILAGGFPCQDYSVAGRKDLSKGLEGSKGVLWWNIFNLLLDLKKSGKQPELVLLENVDRLLKSPANQKGKDFTILLMCLHYLGYDVEYMIINAAEYGFAQRRRRVFIMGHLRTVNPKKRILSAAFPFEIVRVLSESKLFRKNLGLKHLESLLYSYSHDATLKFPDYGNYGFLEGGALKSHKYKASYSSKKQTLLDILQREEYDGPTEDEFFISKEDLPNWEKAKGASKIQRNGLNRETGQKNFVYNYAVGKMSTFDEIKRPIRTIITSEGGKTPSRTKHLIQIKDNYGGKFRTGMRRLTPLELERANCFPDNFTKFNGVGNAKRAFLMGNALVIGIVELIRNSIIENLNHEMDGITREK